MRGPAIFLLCLAGAAILAAVALRPALADRDRLRSELKALDAAGATTPPEVTAAGDRLSKELGTGQGEPDRALAREIAGRFAVDGPVTDEGGEISFVTGVDRLANLLSALESAAGALHAVDVKTESRGDRCRVRIALRAVDR